MKLQGLKKTIGEYRRANAGGYYSPRYGRLMLNIGNGHIWCDEYYDLGHAEHTIYYNPDIVCISRAYYDEQQNEYSNDVFEPLTMKTLKSFITKKYGIQ